MMKSIQRCFRTIHIYFIIAIVASISSRERDHGSCNQRSTQSLSFFVNAETILPIKLYGLNYNTRKGPDWDPEKCKSLSEVITDLKVISRITNRIRLLSLTDCNQGEVVLTAIKDGNIDMSLWLGMWVSEDATVFENEMVQLQNMITSSVNVLPASNVLGITVGSEAIYRGEVTAETIIENANTVKQYLQNSNINDMPVAIVDIADIYQRDTELFDASDVVSVNAFPFWEKLEVDIAVKWLIDVKLPPVWNLANQKNKEYFIAETGWSSQGSNPASSDATLDNQARYFQDFYCQYDVLVNQKYQYYYFTSIDSDWRLSQDADETTVEGHFGLLYSNLTLKSNFQNLIFSCNETGDDSIKYRFDLESSSIGNDPTSSPPQAPSPSIESTGFPVITSPLIQPTGSPLDSGVTKTPAYTMTPTLRTSDGMTNQMAFENASCSSNTYCSTLNLTGNCCPTNNMDFLDCCSRTVPSIDDLSLIPTNSSTELPADSPTNGPTMSLTATTSNSSSTLAPSDQTTDVPIRPIESDEPSDSDTKTPATKRPSNVGSDTITDNPTPSPTSSPTNSEAFVDKGLTISPTPATRSYAIPTISTMTGKSFYTSSFSYFMIATTIITTLLFV